MNSRFHRPKHRVHNAGESQSGFTLVELMISLVIGLFIVLALITLLINVNRNNSELSKTNRVIENGRFALQLLQADISHGGFLGGFIPQFDDLTIPGVPADVPTAVPDPCQDYTTVSAIDKANLIGIAVQSYEIGSPVPSPAVPVCAGPSPVPQIVTSPQPNTDVLVVRHLETCAAGTAGCAALKTDALYFQPSRCGTDTATFTLSTYSPATFNTTDFMLRNRTCAAGNFTEARKFNSNLYYVRNYAVNPGDGVPTLMRSEYDVTSGLPAHQPADALIEGIEGFRVEFGLDTLSDSNAAVTQTFAITWANEMVKTSPTNRGDGIPDGAYVRCGAAGCTWQQLINVVAVKVYVLVRSENRTPGYTDAKTYALGSTTLGPFNDGYKRHLFSQTMRLTNVSGRRETP